MSPPTTIASVTQLAGPLAGLGGRGAGGAIDGGSGAGVGADGVVAAVVHARQRMPSARWSSQASGREDGEGRG